MNHKFEDIDKLKQLDRIEYLLKIKAIRERYDYTPTSATSFIYFISFVLLVLLGWYSAFGTFPHRVLEILPLLLRLYLIVIFFDYALKIYYSFLKNKFEKQVYDSFFRVEVKVK